MMRICYVVRSFTIGVQPRHHSKINESAFVNIQSLLKTIVFGALMASGLVTKAASITWNTPVAIAGDADVSTSGTLAYSYCWSGISTTVNGVSFTGTTSTSSGGANVTLSGFGNNNTSFTGSGSASFSTAYQNMLTGADWNGSASATITFNNLTVGHAYFAQFWVGDWRNYNTSRSETIKGSASDNITPTLTYQVGSSGSGSYVIGTFTASATTQTFTLTPGGSSPSVQINALQLRDLNATASSITWNTPLTIAGDSDVSSTGILAYAYCWSGISTTVNGVNFTGTASTTGAGTDVTLSSGLGNSFTSFGSSPGSTAYQNMLVGGDYNNGGADTVTLNHLTIGDIYVAQFWVGDWRSINSVRSETIKGSVSDNITPMLSYQVGSSGSGTYVIGRFTASAATQTFTLTPGGSQPSAQINALQLRDLSPPVSSIWTNTSGGSWPATANWSNNIAANGIGATAGFNALTLTTNTTVTLDGTRAVGNLLFDDQNTTKHGWTLNTGSGDPLTLMVSNGVPVISNNVSTTIGAVLAGTSGLSKNGSGTLTLSATNTYFGGTTISAGTLQLGDGTIRNGSVSGTITNNGTLIVANPTAQIFANAITGSGGFTKTGSGTLTLSSSNSYQGGTTISAGTLRLLPTQLPSGLQIMPLGDSITYGAYGSDAGYRGFLYNLLNPIAPNFQFTGAATVNPGSLPTSPIDETHHNGYSSYATLDLLNNLNGLDLTRYNEYGGAERNPNGGYWLTGGNGTGRNAVYPDIILLLVGANDIAQGNLGNTNINVASYPTNLTALINELVTLRPTAKVVTADITPEPAQSANTATINSIIHTVVTNFQVQGAQVSEADLFTQFPANGLSGDQLHPNDTGYTFMAGQWYNALLALYTGVSACIPSGSTVTVATNATLDLNGNQATIGGLMGSGNVVLGNGGILNVANSADTSFGGVISGAGALTKTGSGRLILTGTNLYTGATTVDGGTLLVQGYLAGSVTVSNGTLGGTGTVSGSIAINGTIAPGPSGVGALSTGSNSWSSGGTYLCKINGTNETACDEVVIIGSLNVQAASSSPFTIKLVSLTGVDTPGPVPYFNKFASYSWMIVSSSGGVQNFATNEFALDTSSFSNDFSGGTFSLTTDGNSLLVHYIWVPVPPTLDGYGPWSNGSFPLAFSGPNGQTFKILISTNVSLPMANWTPLTSGTFGVGPAAYTDTAATNGTQFYRIVSP
jgi:autotransporter-associated beta strand protein